VHDLLHFDYPATLTKRARLWRHLNLLKLSQRGAVFQVSSEFTRQRLHAAYSIPFERLHRTYLPIHGRLISDGISCSDAYFLYPARAWPHKNHENLLLAYKTYCETVPGKAWSLVLTAGGGERVEGLKSLATQLGIAVQVKFLGDVDESRLSNVYQTASALIFPSRYEGFGIPLIEAMYFGLPIICGRGGSQPEVAGKAAIYVDVEDPADIAAAMKKLTEDNTFREGLAAIGKRQLQKFVLRTEIGKLVNLFEKLGSADFSVKEVPRMRFQMAILFFEVVDVASAVFFLGSDRFRRM
jgi:glycosyltransferase involved in cell wall biosynthesis